MSTDQKKEIVERLFTPEIIQKRSGVNHHSKKEGYVCKTTENNNPMSNPKVVEKISGDNHYMKNPEVSALFRDQTIYCFENLETGEQVSTTRYDFVRRFGIPEGNLSRVINNKRQSVSGWKLAK